MILRYGPKTPNPSLPLKWPALHAVRPPVEPSYGVGCRNALLANSKNVFVGSSGITSLKVLVRFCACLRNWCCVDGVDRGYEQFTA